jgi:pimeloyl-ACP methyl ester carboxylesterase
MACATENTFRPAAVLLAAALTVGCVSHAPLSQSYGGPQTLPRELSTRFEYSHALAADHNLTIRRRHGFLVREVTLPSNFDADDRIRVEYYDVAGWQETPAILLLPIMNGQLLVTRYFAKYFAQRGYAAIVVDRERFDANFELERPERFIRENVLEYRRVLDWVVAQPEIDRDSIGVFGVSLGGIDAVLLAALDQRIDAAVVAMAGGGLPDVVMGSKDRRVTRAVAEVLEQTGLDRQGLEMQLEQAIVTDPLRLAPYVDARDVLMVLTKGDSVVPFESQEALRATMGGPEALYLPTGHRTSVVYFPHLRSSAYEFFARKFE